MATTVESDINIPGRRTVKRIVGYTKVVTPTKVQNFLSWIYDADITQHGLKLAERVSHDYVPEFVLSSADSLDKFGDKTLETTEHRVKDTYDSVQYVGDHDVFMSSSVVGNVREKANARVVAAEEMVTSQVNRLLDITDSVVDKVLPEEAKAAGAVPVPVVAPAPVPAPAVLTRVNDTVVRVKSRSWNRATALTHDSKSWLSQRAHQYVPTWALDKGEASLKWTEDIVTRANSRASQVVASLRDHASAASMRGTLTGMKHRADAFANTVKDKAHTNEGYIAVHEWLSNTYEFLMNGVRSVKNMPVSQHALEWSAMQYQMVHDILARAADVGADSIETSVKQLRKRAGDDPALVHTAMRTVADFLDIFAPHKKEKPMDVLMEELKKRQQLMRPSLSPHEDHEGTDASGTSAPKASYAEAAAGNPTAFEENELAKKTQ